MYDNFKELKIRQWRRSFWCNRLGFIRQVLTSILVIFVLYSFYFCE